MACWRGGKGRQRGGVGWVGDREGGRGEEMIWRGREGELNGKERWREVWMSQSGGREVDA